MLMTVGRLHLLRSSTSCVQQTRLSRRVFPSPALLGRSRGSHVTTSGGSPSWTRSCVPRVCAHVGRSYIARRRIPAPSASARA